MAKDSTFPNVHTLLDKIEAASEDPVPVHRCSANSLKSAVLYIFTSGTTGTDLIKSPCFPSPFI